MTKRLRPIDFFGAQYDLFEFEVCSRVRRMSSDGLRCPAIAVRPGGRQAALLKYFKYTEFRLGQLESALPIIHGRDVLATGSGKSMYMFLAPLAVSESDMAVIISPLNGLMNEQVILILDLWPAG